MIMYKVVYFRKGELISMVAKGKACTTYIPNEWVFAPSHLAREGYHLTVFDNIQDPELFFCSFNYERRLWSCECEGEVPLPVILDIDRLGWMTDVSKIYMSVASSGWPEGTRMFKRVKLLECIAGGV